MKYNAKLLNKSDISYLQITEIAQVKVHTFLAIYVYVNYNSTALTTDEPR
jgi:hypothetical protein